mmetsp:Transcript_43770/g.140600  ORF Transcript_43770/g.140600 Transcript_43770/m.140600 type:complete len:249 (+) Transcript_43770:568-1314(+)
MIVRRQWVGGRPGRPGAAPRGEVGGGRPPRHRASRDMRLCAPLARVHVHVVERARAQARRHYRTPLAVAPPQTECALGPREGLEAAGPADGNLVTVQAPHEQRAARTVASRALPPPRHRDAVEARRAAVGQAGKPRDRRRPVHVTDQRGAVHVPRRDASRPSDDVRETDAALERRLLAAAARSCRAELVLSRLLGPVVRREEHDLVDHQLVIHHFAAAESGPWPEDNGRVVADARLVERREEAADVHV